MNIFHLDEKPATIAKWLVDKHVVKMPLESGQMLSTAKRMLDGKQTLTKLEHPVSGKMMSKTFWLFAGEKPALDSFYKDEVLQLKWVVENSVCYQVAHARHPSTVWTMASSGNYGWHVLLLKEMSLEYTRRYGKRHSTESIIDFLEAPPSNIPVAPMTQPPQAMPDKYKREDSVAAYRRYYAGEKWRFAKWKDGEVPPWFFGAMKEVWTADPQTQNEKINFLAECFSKRTLPLDKRVAMAAAEILKNV